MQGKIGGLIPSHDIMCLQESGVQTKSNIYTRENILGNSIEFFLTPALRVSHKSSWPLSYTKNLILLTYLTSYGLGISYIHLLYLYSSAVIAAIDLLDSRPQL